MGKTRNIANIPIMTNPKVNIWDLKRLWSKLLNKIKTPNETYPYDDFKSLSALKVGSIMLFKIFFSSSSFINLDGE